MPTPGWYWTIGALVALFSAGFITLSYFMITKQIAQPGAHLVKEREAIERGNYAEAETLRRRRTAGAQPAQYDYEGRPLSTARLPKAR